MGDRQSLAVQEWIKGGEEGRKGDIVFLYLVCFSYAYLHIAYCTRV
jgi:hypothetical protein